MKKADLHIHTKASGDAVNEPETVFRAAERAGLAAISFTDHDSFGALKDGETLAEKYSVKFVAGIEISASWKGACAHLLAYFRDEIPETLMSFISASARSGARAMALPIIKKMREMGYDISPEEYNQIAAECGPGDSPLFRLTVKKGFARDIADYQRLFGSLWQKDAVLAFSDARLVIGAVHRAGGLAVIAHPGGSAKNRLFDVLVVGAGPAGIIAAVAAARNGARTILVEKNAFLGGNMALGLPFLGFFNDRRKRIVGSIPWELVERLVKAKASPGPWFNNPAAKYKSGGVIPFDPAALRSVIFNMLSEAGVDLWLYTMFVAPIMRRNAIAGAIFESKSGRQAIMAKTVIDASGDGDVAARAGVPFQKGDPQNGLLQPTTLLFQITDVDMDSFLGDVEKRPDSYHIHNPKNFHYRGDYRRGVRMEISGLEKVCQKATARGDYDVPNPYVIFACMPRKGTLLVNMAKVKGVDGTDNRSLSRAEMEGCENIRKVMRFLKKYVPGMKNARVDWIAPSIGIRETRRIVGQYTLTEQDMRAKTKFDDRVAMGGRYIDVHDPTPDNTGKSLYMTFPDGYFIPFRCLIPQKVGNLLTAGRCISVSYAAYGSTRVMAQCMATGQAAGTAAALAARSNCSVRRINIGELQNKLREQGAIID